MGANETRITRITRALGSVTSIFRCQGLQRVSASADRIGGHDLLYWSAFLALISAWFLFVYMPQCRRLERMVGRQQALLLLLDDDKRELARLRKGIASLNRGDALAWERAARKRLGWLEPGEVLDMERWRSARTAVNNGGELSPRSTPPGPVLPRPRVPQIPRPSQSPPVIVTQTPAPVARAMLLLADSGALGPTLLGPPPPPAIPTLPPRAGLPLAHRVSVPAAQTISGRNGRAD